jgi:hypothetical protein
MAIGIPVAPSKHYFKQADEYFPFTLVFDKLPSAWHLFNLKEYTDGTSIGFEVKKISVNKSAIYRVNVK